MAQKTVTSYFQSDHARLDGLFGQFLEFKEVDGSKAKGFFRDFYFGLKRHIVWEEEVLFPFFDKKSGMIDCGPTAVMKEEHHRIGAALEALHNKLKRNEFEVSQEAVDLLSVLKEHNDKEEDILYPTIDRMATPHEQVQIFKQMEQIPKDKIQSCC